jgi:hypothetical protein
LQSLCPSSQPPVTHQSTVPLQPSPHACQ